MGIILVSAAFLAAALWIAGPDDVLADLQKFPAWSIISVFGLLALNLVVVTLRLARILTHFGITLSPTTVTRASISGHLAGLLIVSIFGQVVGRQLALRRFGVSSMLVATLTAYERVILVVMSASICFVGAALLIDQSVVFDFLTKISLFEIALVVGGGLVLSAFMGRSRFEMRLLSRTAAWSNITNFLEVGIVTIVAQLLVLASFVVAVLALNPDVNWFYVLAAAAIISFAASLPLTVNGWGVRELTAVYTLEQLGISSSNALAVSILIGLCSTAVILAAAPVVLKKNAASNSNDVDSTGEHKSLSDAILPGRLSKAEIEKAAVWVLAMAAAVLIFIQIHVELPNGVINLNLADPFAILALAATLAHAITTLQFPRWRIAGFSFWLMIISALIIFAFVRGVLEIGVTQWAFASRLMGWLLLLGYLSIGYQLVSHAGTHGLRRFAETMVATAVVILVFQISVRWLSVSGWGEWFGITEWGKGFNFSSNFEGYAGNRNAFAFQLLVCSVLLLAYSAFYTRAGQQKTHTFISRQVIFALLHGIVLVGIVYTGSLGGLITGVVLLVLAWVWKQADRRMIELSVLIGGVIWSLPFAFIWLLNQFGATPDGIKGAMIQTGVSPGGSNALRWETITKGLELWWENPLFGTGLGVFIEQSTTWFGKTTVIHSTPVWLLTEFGLIGTGVLVWVAFVFVQALRKNWKALPAYRIVALLLVVFAIFSLVHDIFYQRIFWLVLGGAVAISFYHRKALGDAPKLICHIITGLNTGGAERMLTRLVGADAGGGGRHMVVSLMDEGVFGKEIRAKGVELYTLGMRRGVPSPHALWRLVQLVRREKPDVLMTWLYHADLLGFVAGRLAGIKRMYWNLRCSDMTKANQSILSRLLMWLLARLSLFPTVVLANSEAGKRHHQSLGYHPKKWRVISNGVNLDQFHPDPDAAVALHARLGLSDDAVLVGHLARFHPMKDHATLLKAAAAVLKSNPEAHFVLVGRDVDTHNTTLSELVQNTGHAERIHLLGDRRDVPQLLAGLDLLTVSSAYGEGAPNVIIEAMACAVPCVVTDVGDAALIIDGAGRVVQPRDPAALAEAIAHFLNLPSAERGALGQKARARAVEHYDINSVIKRYQTLFAAEG